MRVKICVLVMLLSALVVAGPVAAVAPEKASMEKAKVLLFDKNWSEALREIDGVLSREPDHPSALFYRGRCLEKLGRRSESLQAYTRFLSSGGASGLREEAHISIIDLSFRLLEDGERKYAKKIFDYLTAPNVAVRYYAALKLSYLKDKKTAGRAVPVLKSVIETEQDPELVDRARIGLLRIDPDLLRGTGKRRNLADAMLRIQVVNRKTRKVQFSINLPFMLARLALEALPDADKEKLNRKGYSLDRIIRTLSESREIIRIEGEDGEVRIWVEEKKSGGVR